MIVDSGLLFLGHPVYFVLHCLKNAPYLPPISYF